MEIPEVSDQMIIKEQMDGKTVVLNSAADQTIELELVDPSSLLDGASVTNNVAEPATIRELNEEDMPTSNREIQGLPKREYDFYPIDTSDLFASVFEGKDKFDSWEEFIILFEEFQRLSQTVFKSRGGTSCDFVNTKRVTHKIPAKFVYQKVKMICLHYGSPKIVPKIQRRRKSGYIGLNCEAFVKISYKKGHLHITDLNLIHTNHPLLPRDRVDAVIRKIRPINYTDEMDLAILEHVDKHQVFRYKMTRQEARWAASLEELQEMDGMQHLTSRMLKKRMGALMEDFRKQYPEGEVPEHDQKGLLLQRIFTSKELAETEPKEARKRGRRKGNLYGSKPAESYEDYLRDRSKFIKKKTYGSLKAYTEDDESFMENSYDFDEPGPSSSKAKVVAGSDTSSMSKFMNYWKTKRDDENQRLWQNEMDLRREEIAMKRKELELQKEKFEFEKTERMRLYELLKQQSELVKDGALSVEDPEKNKELAATARAMSLATEYVMFKDGGEVEKDPS